MRADRVTGKGNLIFYPPTLFTAPVKASISSTREASSLFLRVKVEFISLLLSLSGRSVTMTCNVMREVQRPLFSAGRA